MSNSPLSCMRLISPNRNSPRNHKIDTISIHCVVGQMGVEALCNEFSRPSKATMALAMTAASALWWMRKTAPGAPAVLATTTGPSPLSAPATPSTLTLSA